MYNSNHLSHFHNQKSPHFAYFFFNHSAGCERMQRTVQPQSRIMQSYVKWVNSMPLVTYANDETC